MKIIILFITLLSVVSCEKRIEIEIPEHQTKTVINCFFKPNEPLNVFAYKTVAITEPLSVLVENANINLYKDAVFVETLQFRDSLYQSEHLIEEEAIYKITADLLNLDPISATNHAPTPPMLISTAFLGLIASNEWSNEYQISFEMEDDVNKENYYEAKLFVEYNNYISEYFEYPSSQVLGVDFKHDTLLRDEGVFFSDVLFNGNTQLIKGDFTIPKDLTIKKLTLKLRAVTKEYYTYSTTLGNHLNSQTGDDIFGYIEPIDMYSNIEGGYGIFAGYSEVEQVLVDNTK